MKQVYEVPKVPTIGDKNWNFALAEIQRPFVRLGKFDDAIETQIMALNGYWNIILHWVVKKKWVKNHRIPGYRPDIKAYEPLGELFFRMLELCIQAHQLAPSGYVNGADWFARIIRHKKQESFNTIFAIASGAEEPPTKTQIVHGLQKEVRALGSAKPENPYDPSEDLHLHRLIQVAIEYNSPLEDYWKPFTKAFRLWAREFSGHSWNVRYAKGGKIHRTTEPGRDKSIVLYS